MDLLLKIACWAILYGACCFGLGVFIGQMLKDEAEDEREEWFL